LPSNAAALHEVSVTGCLAPDLQHLCLHNLGATVLPFVPNRSFVYDIITNGSALSAEDAAAVCRCHAIPTMANATAAAKLAGTDWCRSYAAVDTRLRSTYRRFKRAMGLAGAMITKPTRKHSQWMASLKKAPKTFNCEAAAQVYLMTCARFWPVHDVRRNIDVLSDAAVDRVFHEGIKAEFRRSAEGVATVVPDWSEQR
jgi:hypothetical protein